MKRTEAHSAVQPRRSVAHTRRLATLLADRKVLFCGHPGLKPHGSDGPTDSRDRHCAFFGLTRSLGARGVGHLRHGGHGGEPLSYIARLRIRSSDSVKALGRPRFSTLERAAAARTAVAA